LPGFQVAAGSLALYGHGSARPVARRGVADWHGHGHRWRDDSAA
jgi:hypothetical protein